MEVYFVCVHMHFLNLLLGEEPFNKVSAIKLLFKCQVIWSRPNSDWYVTILGYPTVW